jgi:predicted dehydrogenase
MSNLKVGLIGCGFISELHMHAYRRVYGVNVEVVSVAARGDQVVDFARKYAIPETTRDYRTLLTDPRIDVIDICTPPALHAGMVIEAMQAGKHVICEKPFTGYFGRPGDPTPIGKAVSKALMYERVMEEMETTVAAVRQSGRLFMYAEDWIYAPAVTKAAEMLRATRDKILFMKAEESHSGSHAAHAAQWAQTGGGALIRQGCHPLSAMLHLKQVEANARGTAHARGASLYQGESVRCGRLGHVEPDLQRQHEGNRLLRRHDPRRCAQRSGSLHERRRAIGQHHTQQPSDDLHDR